jgi:Ca2+-binding EF-hand superfamily protein
VQGKEEALRTAFIELDKDGSGHLDVEELAACLLGCGFRITKHQVLALARLLDTNRSGAVDVQEFLNALGVTSA